VVAGRANAFAVFLGGRLQVFRNVQSLATQGPHGPRPGIAPVNLAVSRAAGRLRPFAPVHAR